MAVEKKVIEAERILSQNVQSEAAILQQKPKPELTKVEPTVRLTSVVGGMIPTKVGEKERNITEDPVKIFLNGAQKEKDKPLTSQQMGGIITVGKAGPDLMDSCLKQDNLRRIVQTTTLFSYFGSSQKPVQSQKEATV